MGTGISSKFKVFCKKYGKILLHLKLVIDFQKFVKAMSPSICYSELTPIFRRPTQ
jgi:hypothetical protein